MGLMRKRCLFALWLMLWFAVAASAAGRKFTLVIDAGHGGHDAGAIGAISKEKNINLNVALAFGRYVERNCPDVKVIYTRKTDVFIPLHERANIANRAKADLFVSIHTNSLPAGRIARGLETYTLGMHRAGDNFDVAKRENSVILIEKDYQQHYEGFDPRSSESYIMFEFMQDKYMERSVELAKLVQQRVCTTANRPNKGVKQAGFLVLRETSMPSCLIELGFISTPDEERFLNSNEGIDKLGLGIYQAFVAYKKKYDTSITVPYRAETTQAINIPQVVPAADKPAAKPAPSVKPARPAQQPQQAAVAEAAAQPADTVAQQPAQVPVQQQADAQPVSEQPADVPVFKVQILASGQRLPANSPQLKGLTGTDSYEEGGYVKSTIGSSADYNEIYQLRRSLLDKFPEAFIIAFKGGKKMNVTDAIREYKQNKNKR